MYEALDSGQVAGAAFDVFVDRAGDRKPAVRPAQRGLHAASRRLHHRGAGECRAAGRRADGRLSAARRHLQRGQLSLDHGRGGAQAQAVRGACRKARLVCRPAHRDRHQAGADFLRRRRRADEHQRADLGGDRRSPSPDAAGRQRGLGADRRQGPRHRRRGNAPRGRGRLRKPDHAHRHHRPPDRAMSPAPSMPTAARASSTSRASAWTPNSAPR